MNPKINNIYNPINQAKYDILWVLDATISVSKLSLLHSVSALTSPTDPSSTSHPAFPSDALLYPASDSETVKCDPNDPAFSADASGVGLVHHVPFAWVPEKTFGARLEQAYLNSTHAKMYLAIVRRLFPPPHDPADLSVFRSALRSVPAERDRPRLVHRR